MRSADEPIFNRANMVANGLRGLEEGLPEVPSKLTLESVIPMAQWKSSQLGAVLFLQYSKNDDGTVAPGITRGIFRREVENWIPLKHWSGSGWPHNPLVDADSDADLDGRSIHVSGGSFGDQPRGGHPGIVINGRHSPRVKDISVTQDEVTLTVPANGHWGAWIVCLAEWSPYTMVALDEKGIELSLLQGPPQLPNFGPTK